MTFTTGAALAASVFINTLGVNTHIDFNRYGYENLTQVEESLKYLGVKNVRDSSQRSSTLTTWPRVSRNAGVKFANFMTQGSPTDMENSYRLVPALAEAGVLNFIEGGNENDSAYSVGRGNSIDITAQFQQRVYTLGKSLGIPVINMSFGAGWTAANNWRGNYDKTGDLSTVADYANAHTYPNVGQKTGATINRLNGLALLAARTRPVITTEIGWNENLGHKQADIAKYVLQAAFDGIKYGNPKTYFYALYDDGSGKFGLMNQNGTPKPAGRALHNLTTILADPDATDAFVPGSFSYDLSGALGGENRLVIQKSDGSYWLSVWDETNYTHTVTVKLASKAQQVEVYDPLTGTSPVQSIANADAVSFSLADSPILVKVVATETAPAPSPGELLVQVSATNVISSFSNNQTFSGDANTQAIYLYGSGNTVTGGSGTYTLQAFKGGNTIYAGAGTAQLRIGGSGNKVYIGTGKATIHDSGTGNAYVFDKAGTGSAEIFGYILAQNTKLDFTKVLAATAWDRSPATLGNFLKVEVKGTATIVSVNTSGSQGGVAYPVVTLRGYAYLTLAKLQPFLTF